MSLSEPSHSRARRSPIARQASYSRWVDTLAYPVRFIGAVISYLPLKGVQLLGRILGVLWSSLVPIRKGVVLENLEAAFPDLPRSQRELIARRTFQHVSTTVLELLWLDRRRHDDLPKHIRVEGIENYHNARGEGRGVIVITAHIGNWDLLACSQALEGIPLRVVTKELSSKGLSRLWMERRREAGIEFIPARESVLSIIRALRRGDVVGMVVDQRTRAEEGGTLLPFFGHPAWTTQAPHILAARTGSALLPVWSIRESDGSHVVRIGHELDLKATAEATMTKINALVERWVTWNPDQWLWLHRRWKL